MTATYIPLGSWERLLALAHRRDNAFCAGWLAELDRPLDVDLVGAALAAVRGAYPAYFARVRDDGQNFVLQSEPQRPIEEMIRHTPRFEGGGAAYVRALANDRLDPVDDGSVRCHLVDGPIPLIALQMTHVPGDGYGNWRLREALAGAIGALSGGLPAAVEPAEAVHDISYDGIRSALSMDVRAFEDVARRAGRLRELRMSADAPGDDGAYELRVFQASVDVPRYARVVSRARALGVTPVALLAAAFVRAASAACDPWADRRRDFIALNMPRDFRGLLGLAGRIGNVTFPQGLPVLDDDPHDHEALAPVLFERLQRGRTNLLMYRHFLRIVHDAGVVAMPTAAPLLRLKRSEGRLVLDPFSAFGATEVLHRGDFETLGPARVVRTLFQTPMLTRRFANGRAHLSCTVRWHPAMDARLRGLFAGFVERLFGGDPVEWELL